MKILDLIKSFYGVKNTRSLVLRLILDVAFYSMFVYIAFQSKNGAGFCVSQHLIPYEFYSNYILNKSQVLNQSLINSANVTGCICQNYSMIR